MFLGLVKSAIIGAVIGTILAIGVTALVVKFGLGSFASPYVWVSVAGLASGALAGAAAAAWSSHQASWLKRLPSMYVYPTILYTAMSGLILYAVPRLRETPGYQAALVISAVVVAIIFYLGYVFLESRCRICGVSTARPELRDNILPRALRAFCDELRYRSNDGTPRPLSEAHVLSRADLHSAGLGLQWSDHAPLYCIRPMESPADTQTIAAQLNVSPEIVNELLNIG